MTRLVEWTPDRTTDRYTEAAAGAYDRYFTHSDARTETDCWTVNVGDAGVVIRRGGPSHGADRHRPVALVLTRQDAEALAHAILEGVTS